MSAGLTPTSDGTPALRRAVPADAAACAALVRSLSPAFFAHPDGRDTALFWDSVSAERQAGYIAAYAYWVAEVDGVVVGLAALRPPQHVFHLFVAADWQGQGLGRRLLDRLLADTDPAQPVTVNASLLAQAFYARWGFVIQGPAQLQHGVRFQPMVRSVA